MRLAAAQALKIFEPLAERSGRLQRILGNPMTNALTASGQIRIIAVTAEAADLSRVAHHQLD